MTNISKVFSFLGLLIMMSTFHACVDTEFDQPDVQFDISDEQVMTIAEVMSFLPGSGNVLLTDDLLGSDEMYVAGIVTSDDTEGNFFKAIYFQDPTGALVIEPDQNELNAVYPRGHIVYVKLNGLYLLRDSNVPKLAFAIDGTFSVRTPDARVKDFVFAGGPADSVITPELVTVTDIANNAAKYFNKLVTITNVEVSAEFLGQTYATADGVDGPQSENILVTGCESNETLTLRNSGFSSFAGDPLPLGSGTMTCIVNKFGSTTQLFIRDTDDMSMNGNRCDGTTGSGDFPENELDLSVIKNDFISQGIDKIPVGFITGVVISEDNITNRNLVFQSGSAGVIIRFATAHDYQLGQRLKINVGGYSFNEFNGGTQLEGLSPQAILEDGTSALPEPINVTVAEVANDIYKYESVRIKVTGATLGTGVYAGNFDISDASGSIGTFIQPFASFIDQAAPAGLVDVVGYGSFYNSEQIIFNKPTDVTGGSIPDFPTNELDLGDIRSAFWNLGVSQIPEGFIQGVVISADNITNKNLVLQSGGDGIILRFAAAHNYQLGQQLKVNVSNRSVTEFNGGTQIDGLSSVSIIEDGMASLPSPIDVTVADLTSDIYAYESIRVKISGATLGSSSYTGNINITDATGSLVTFIQPFATFVGQAAPSGSVDIIGYGSYYNTEQIIFNSPSDVTGGNTGSGDAVIEEDFQAQTDNSDIQISGWMNIATKGTRKWAAKSFMGERYAECEGYQAPDSEVEAWLITPEIDVDASPTLTFESAMAFWQHSGLTVWISPDFDNFEDAEWTEITGAILANSSNDDFEIVPSGVIDLAALESGTVRVGWKYVGDPASNTTKMRIDNVVVK